MSSFGRNLIHLMAVTECKQAFTYVNTKVPSHSVQTLISQWSTTAVDYAENPSAYKPAKITFPEATRGDARREGKAMRRRHADKSSPDDYKSFMSPTHSDIHRLSSELLRVPSYDQSVFISQVG